MLSYKYFYLCIFSRWQTSTICAPTLPWSWRSICSSPVSTSWSGIQLATASSPSDRDVSRGRVPTRQTRTPINSAWLPRALPEPARLPSTGRQPRLPCSARSPRLSSSTNHNPAQCHSCGELGVVYICAK